MISMKMVVAIRRVAGERFATWHTISDIKRNARAHLATRRQRSGNRFMAAKRRREFERLCGGWYV